VSPGASLDMVVERRKFHCPCQESNPGHPTHSIVTILTELPQLIKLIKENSHLLKSFYLLSFLSDWFILLKCRNHNMWGGGSRFIVCCKMVCRIVLDLTGNISVSF